MKPPDVTVEVHLRPEALQEGLRAEALTHLCGERRPRELSPKWLYDERGSQLFEEITRLPEYYPTRRERAILEARAAEVARACPAETLLELGSGSSEKTRWLLDALQAHGNLRRFIPFDVSEDFLRQSAEAVARRYPSLCVHAVVGDFEHHLGRLPRGGRRLVAFLGGTVGNLKPWERTRFFSELAAGLEPGDALLLGTDLLKDRSRLFAAYNDSAGVTAAFNRNVLHRLNRELGADFVPEDFMHLAPFDEEQGWVEMRLVSSRPQRVWLGALGQEVHFEQDEVLRTEVSCKFRREQVESELADAGLHLAHWWTDADGDFALSLSLKR
jgi:L-histidine N-alpha-methyltransferase